MHATSSRSADHALDKSQIPLIANSRKRKFYSYIAIPRNACFLQDFPFWFFVSTSTHIYLGYISTWLRQILQLYFCMTFKRHFVHSLTAYNTCMMLQYCKVFLHIVYISIKNNRIKDSWLFFTSVFITELVLLTYMLLSSITITSSWALQRQLCNLWVSKTLLYKVMIASKHT